MTRDIRFKLWSKEEKRMLTKKELKGYSIGAHDGHVLFIDGHDCNERYIKLQYTGEVDRKGQEIYEGDVVQVRVDHKNFFIDIIEFSNGEFYGKLNSLKYFLKHYKNVEVIGNTYENPERQMVWTQYE